MITGFKPVDPRGGMTADPRVIIATTTPSGNAICEQTAGGSRIVTERVLDDFRVDIVQ